MRTGLRQPGGQQGMALLITLVALLIITVLAVAATRTTSLQERMVANNYDQTLAFQAAESALQEAENYLDPDTTATLPSFSNADGLYTEADADGTPRWEDSDTVWLDASSDLGELVPTTPQYIIEYMGTWPDPPGCDQTTDVPADCLRDVYRITARSNAADRAQVMLQAIYWR